MRIFYLLGFLFACLSPLTAQEADTSASSNSALVNNSRPRVDQYLEIGISANAYWGDLSSLEQWSPIFHVAWQFNRARRFNSRIGLSLGYLTGENRFYLLENNLQGVITPNTFFRTSWFSVDYDLRYNISKSRNHVIFVSQGIGLLRFDPQDEEGASLLDDIATRPEGETYSNAAVYFPTSIGAAYYLKNGYGIGCQLSVLNTQSDFIDNLKEWGVESGNDNALRFKIHVLIPLKKTAARKFPSNLQDTYTF